MRRREGSTAETSIIKSMERNSSKKRGKGENGEETYGAGTDRWTAVNLAKKELEHDVSSPNIIKWNSCLL